MPPIFDEKDHAQTPWRRAGEVGEDARTVYDDRGYSVCHVLGHAWMREQLTDSLIAISKGQSAPRALAAFFPTPWSFSCGMISDASGRAVLSVLSTRGDTYWEADVAKQLIAMVNANA